MINLKVFINKLSYFRFQMTRSHGENKTQVKWRLLRSGVRRKFPRGGPKHRSSQGRAKGAMPPPKFVENIVILCFERRFSKQSSVIRLKLNILVYTAEYWQYTLPKTVYTFFIFRVWGEGRGTVASPLRTLVLLRINQWTLLCLQCVRGTYRKWR